MKRLAKAAAITPQNGNRGAAPRCALAKRPTSHANPAAALVREGVRGRSQALDRSLRTPPKCPTRAKEQGCQLAGASSVCGHPGIIRYSSRNNTVETSYMYKLIVLAELLRLYCMVRDEYTCKFTGSNKRAESKTYVLNKPPN